MRKGNRIFKTTLCTRDDAKGKRLFAGATRQAKGWQENEGEQVPAKHGGQKGGKHLKAFI